MFGFFKNKFEKDAQAAIQRRAQQMAPKAAAKAAKPAPAGDREQDIARMQAQVQQFVTPERQALIKNALAVQRAKRKILDDLDDESRAKLVAMAITALMREGDPKPPKK